jgi:hypothetical protein
MMLCLLFIEGEKEREKKREKQPRGFFPQGQTHLLAVPRGIFMALRCN